MPAASSNARRRRRCSRRCACPTPRRCWRRSRRSMPRRIRRCRRSRDGRRIRPGRSRAARSRRAAAMPPAAVIVEKPALTAAESPAHQFACFHPIETPGRRSRMMQQADAIRAIRCSRWKTSSSNMPSAARPSTRCPTSVWTVARGETLGLVGESGCGKSTLGRAVLQLRQAVSGRVLFDGQDLTAMQGDALRKMRQRVQLIFQDPIASLNPRRRIGDIVAEPLVIAGVKDPEKRQQLVCEVLSAVGPRPRARDRAPAARIFRRTMPAHLHCAGAGAQSRIHHLRRAGLGARRFHPRPNPQSAGGDEGALTA